MPITPLSKDECLFYRDRLRSARYAALADAEGFSEICFAVEALGMRLCEKQETLGGYRKEVVELAEKVPERETLAQKFSGCFTRFEALYNTLKKTRNDVMHTGAYARHATSAAIELCIHLEEALMAGNPSLNKVKDYMVKAVVHVEPWHPVAHARQLMLTHSFSFLPVYINGKWKLISELSVARFLPHSLSTTDRLTRLGTSIEHAAACVDGLCLLDALEVKADSRIDTILAPSQSNPAVAPTLWLVTDKQHPGSLQGVLTPFELM